MILSLIILVPLVIISLWAFFTYAPKAVERTRLFRYNMGVLGIGILLCGALTYKFYSILAGTTDRAWWPVLSALGSMLLFSVCLAVGGLLRNLVVLRSSDKAE